MKKERLWIFCLLVDFDYKNVYIYIKLYNSAVAQLVERLTVNQNVTGSSPVRRARITNGEK